VGGLTGQVHPRAAESFGNPVLHPDPSRPGKIGDLRA
jgi:hypothetical protein